MLAPFTAGWQSADLNPLVIEKSEVLPITLLSIISTGFLVGSSYVKKTESMNYFLLHYSGAYELWPLVFSLLEPIGLSTVRAHWSYPSLLLNG